MSSLTAGASNHHINWYMDTLTPGIAGLSAKIEDGLEEEMIQAAVDMVEYMKTNARWQDRTGDARAGLDAEVFKEEGAVGIYLFHGVDYGIWLELRWSGRYAIILPTMESQGPALMRRLQGLLDRLDRRF